MKKFFKLILNNKILIAILLVVAIGLPTAIFKKAQGEETTIVVAVGIDKKEGKYQLSIQSANALIKPTTTSSASASQSEESKLEVIDDEGLSIADAINNIEIKTGRTLGFEHCHLIVLSDSVSAENCKTVLDFFYRKANITLGAFLLSTDQSANTLLKKTCNSENTSTSNLQKNLGFNKNNYSSANLTTIGDFFNDYYSESKTSTIAFLKSEEAMEKDSSKINNEGISAVFFNGKKFGVIDKNLTKGMNWVNLQKAKGKMVLTDVSDEEFFNNATVTIQFDDAKIDKTFSIKNGYLTINLDISIKAEVLEISQKDSNLHLSLGSENYLSETLKNKIKQQIQNEISAIHSYSVENKVDVCNFFNLMNAYKNSEYKNWKNSLSASQFFEKMQITSNINVYSFR